MKSMVLPTAAVASGCAPVPGAGPLLGPDASSVLLLALLVGAAVYAFARLRPRIARRSSALEGEPPSASIGPAVRIVRERYARGELTREEYFRLVDDLAKR